jgi:hypothetical protein
MKKQERQCWTCRYGVSRPIGSGIRYVVSCDAPMPPADRVEMYEAAAIGDCGEYEREPGAEG